jgi:site-specific DNA-cytosine methylase
MRYFSVCSGIESASVAWAALAWTPVAFAEIESFACAVLAHHRLQGLPDNYTLVPYRGGIARDAPRYRAIGNAIACNVMRWIGRRIEMVEGLL